MSTAEIAGILVEAALEETQSIYASIKESGCEKCGCAYCRNFSAQLPMLFPEEVLTFFRKAGIDLFKDAEVYELGENSPGIHVYGGEYYFISKDRPKVDAGILNSGFQFTFTEPSPLVQDEFKNKEGALCFYFTCEVPWVLKERP